LEKEKVPSLHLAVDPLGAPVSEITGPEVLVGVLVAGFEVVELLLTGVPPLVQVLRALTIKSFST
jgi:hypothetical protein